MSSLTLPTLTLPRPDDWHVHFRDGEMLKTVAPLTAKVFGRAIVMPNLKPAVLTTADAGRYRDRILRVLPEGSTFKPLMTLYLTELTDGADVAAGKRDGVVTAAKLYPAFATTNAEAGVSDVTKIYPLFETMQKIGLPLLIHGEATNREIDIFDREKVFLDETLIPLRRHFPELKIVLEHVTTREAVDYVEAEGKKGKTAATITAHHLLINRNAMFAGGIRPHFYCLPVAKREKHREALVRAATGGAPMFFLGTDSAPHARGAKEAACGCAGIFTAANALCLYADVFERSGELARLEGFASRNGPAFYDLPVNNDLITLEKLPDTAPEIKSILTEGGQEVVPFLSPHPVLWRVAAG